MAVGDVKSCPKLELIYSFVRRMPFRIMASYGLAFALVFVVAKPVMTELIEVKKMSFTGLTASTTGEPTTTNLEKIGVKVENANVTVTPSTPIVLAYGIRTGSLVLMFGISLWAIVTIIRID